MTEIEKLEALAAKATPGPWGRETDDVLRWPAFICSPQGRAIGEVYPEEGEANAALIVALVNEALPALRKLQAENDALREASEDAFEMASKHRRIALDYKFGTRVAEKLPTDKEWMAYQDKHRSALGDPQ